MEEWMRGEKRIEVSRRVRGHRITAALEWLDCGVCVTIFGGERSHIGASVLADKNGLHTVELLGHKEGQLCERWALALFAAIGEPLAVTAGVHYDHLDHEGLCAVMRELDALLEELLGRLGQGACAMS